MYLMWKYSYIDSRIFQRKVLILLILTLTLVLSASILNKPQVLIIGDSISIGYTPFVKEHFKNNAIVSHNQGNAGDTGRGLKNIIEYLGDGNWDIILFNWGLWDLCYRHPASKLYGNRDKVNGTITFTVEEYKSNLDSLVQVMKSNTEARLIFVTTTYVPENEAGRYAKDAKIYNKAAKEVMKRNAISICDIYKKSKSIHKFYGIGNDDVHYTEKGNQLLAKLIIERLEKEISSLES